MEGAGSHTGLLGTPPFCTLSSFDIVMFSGSNTALKTFGMTWDEVTSYLKLKHQLHRHGDYGLFHNMGQIFDSLVPKTCKIKNTFGILQTNPQIPQEWDGPFYFLKNMFCLDTLLSREITTLSFLWETLILITWDANLYLYFYAHNDQCICIFMKLARCFPAGSLRETDTSGGRGTALSLLTHNLSFCHK